MQNNTYRVRVIPDMSNDRAIARTISAQNATEAAGSVLLALGGRPVDCIEVKQSDRRTSGKIAFYACVYGMVQGFLYTDRFVLAS